MDCINVNITFSLVFNQCVKHMTFICLLGHLDSSESHHRSELILFLVSETNHQVYHVLKLGFNQLVFCYSVYVID